MKYKYIDSQLLIRFDRGENLIESLLVFCGQNNVKCASVSGIGATDKFACGVYNVDTQKYKDIEFEGSFEILSLSGNITSMNDRPYIHIHITACDENGACFGGHLKEARISATCEMILSIIDCTVGRKKDELTGLNLMDL